MQLTRNRLAIAPFGAPLGVAVVAGLGCGAILLADPTTPGGLLPVCPTKALLGIDCPGCGSLRMLYSLMHGNIVAATQFNALGLIAVVMSAWAFVAWTYGRAVNRKVVSWQHHRWAAAIALVAVGIWFIVRNVPIVPFTSLHV